nr:DUF4097 family beta strand repeat-containing protein [bacterium]
MKQSAIIRIVVWSLVALVLIGVLIMGLNGSLSFGLPIISIGQGYTYPNSERYTAGPGSVPSAGVQKILVNWIAGGVEITACEGDTIEFSETAPQSLDDNQQLHFWLDGDTLRIQYTAPYKGLTLFHNVPSKTLQLQVPQSIAQSLQTLEVTTVSSTLDVDGVGATYTKLETVSGRMTLAGMACDNLDVNSVSGTVQGEGLTVGSLNSENVSGNLRISGQFTRIEHNSVSGQTDIISSACPERLSIEAVSGTISITVPENDGFTAQYDSVSGDFRCDFPTTSEKKKATYKNGGASFDFDTVSGNISIHKQS